MCAGVGDLSQRVLRLCQTTFVPVSILYSDVLRTSPSDRLCAMTPQMHLFPGFAEYGAIEIGDPSLFWCCIDEDYVGWISQLAFSRGGRRSSVSTPENAIGRYRALA